jgi:hypothetical protein
MVKLHKTDGGRQSSGFTCENKDCTVRSFACAADVPYTVAHDVARRAGRKNGQGWHPDKILKVAAEDGLVEFKAVPVGAQNVLRRDRWCGLVTKIQYPTVEQVVRRHTQGRYIVVTCNHAMALIDGVVHDGGVHPKARVQEIFEIRPIETKPAITQAQVNELWERLNRLEAR